MWPCDFNDCTRPAVRLQGECILCNMHMCARHLQPQFHKCPPWEVSKKRALNRAHKKKKRKILRKAFD